MFIRKLLVAAAAPAAVAAMVLGGAAGVASASTALQPNTVNSTVVYTGPSNAGGVTAPTHMCVAPLTSCTDSMAGWYTSAFGQTFSQVDATFTLNAEAEGIGVSVVHGVDSVDNPTGHDSTHINGAIGAQLCANTEYGYAAQIGAAYLGDGQFALGYTVGNLRGLTSDPCVGGGVLPDPDQFSLLGAFPVGSSVQAEIKQEFSSHGDPTILLFTAQLVGGVTDYTYALNGFGFYPNEAGAGLQTDTTGLSAPAMNDLTDFSNVTATSDGVTTGLANWNAVEVAGSQDGMGPALLTPDEISPTSGTVCVNHPAVYKYDWVGHLGHRAYYDHGRKFVWVKGDRHEIRVKLYNAYTTCTGGGPSAFSVDAGTPVS